VLKTQRPQRRDPRNRRTIGQSLLIARRHCRFDYIPGRGRRERRISSTPIRVWSAENANVLRAVDYPLRLFQISLRRNGPRWQPCATASHPAGAEGLVGCHATRKPPARYLSCGKSVCSPPFRGDIAARARTGAAADRSVVCLFSFGLRLGEAVAQAWRRAGGSRTAVAATPDTRRSSPARNGSMLIGPRGPSACLGAFPARSAAQQNQRTQ